MKTRMESFIWMLATAVFGYAMFSLGMRQAYTANGNAEEVAIAIFYYMLAGAVWGLALMFAKDVLKRKTVK